MKKVLTILILFTLVLSVVSPAFAETNQPPQMQPPIKFNDLGDYKWGIDAVDRMAAKGVIKGVGNNKFAPASPVTHLEVLAFLVRLIDPPIRHDSSVFYDDLVKKYKEWGADVILRADDFGLFTYENSYLTGFDFNEPAKRYEVAEYLIRALELVPLAYLSADKQQQFSDWGSIPKGYNGFLYEAVNQGLFKGDGKALRPLDNVKRIEVAVLLDRLDKYLLKQEENPSKDYLVSYIIQKAVNSVPPEWILAIIDFSGSEYNPKYKYQLSLGGYLAGVTGINSNLIPDIVQKLRMDYKEGMEFDAKTNIDMMIGYLEQAYAKRPELIYILAVYQNGFEKADQLEDSVLHERYDDYEKQVKKRADEWASRLQSYIDTLW